MAERKDIARQQGCEASKWTRLTDYWPDVRNPLGGVRWGEPVSVGDFRRRPRPDVPQRVSRRGLAVPIAAVLLAVLLSIWGSGILREPNPAGDVPQTRSAGLVFGLCSTGGLTNCVASGDSFYLGGKTVRLAGIEAPQIYGAACPKEAALGQTSAARLQALLNSGQLQLTEVGPDLVRLSVGIEHIDADREALASWARRLRPGGTLLISTPSGRRS